MMDDVVDAGGGGGDASSVADLAPANFFGDDAPIPPRRARRLEGEFDVFAVVAVNASFSSVPSL